MWDARVGGGGERSERRELQDGLDDAIVEAAAHGQADGAEHELHVGVAGEDGGGEREQATFVGDDGESFEEQRGDTFSVVVVGDGERDLGFGRVGTDDVLTDPDQPAIDRGEQGDVFGTLADDASQFAVGERTAQSEESVVRGRVAESFVEVAHRGEVSRCGSADVDGLTGGEQGPVNGDSSGFELGDHRMGSRSLEPSTPRRPWWTRAVETGCVSPASPARTTTTGTDDAVALNPTVTCACMTP